MSGFACMFFQDASVTEFQRRMEVKSHQNNLRQLFHAESIPKDSQFRELIDGVDSDSLQPIFKDFLTRLQRGRYLQDFQILPDHYICAIDGVYHHSSEKVHCEQCLHKTGRNGSVSYSHSVLQGALMHPNQKQVIFLRLELFSNTDGEQKQDCEISAAKRFVTRLKADHTRLGLTITGDGLFSNAPMIGQVSAAGLLYLFVAKPKDHTYMMNWLKGYPQLPLVESQDDKGQTHQFRYMNRVPLNGSKSTPEVNYLHYQMVNCSTKVAFTNSWVTGIEVTQANVCALAKGTKITVLMH
jgi:hypothetical protein